MAERILQMDDINLAIDPARVTEIFRKLGYQILGQAIAIADLELSSQSTADIYEAHLIADQRSRNLALADLQVLLITLKIINEYLYHYLELHKQAQLESKLS